MYRRLPLRFVPVSALLAASLTLVPAAAIAKPAGEQSAPAASEAVANGAFASFAPAEPKNGIPMMTVFIDESSEAIEKANADDAEQRFGKYVELIEDSHHTTRCVGGATIVLPDGYKSEYGEATVPEGVAELKYIRGRGNSSWETSNKKPYKLAFKNKQNLLGMGKAKQWALLADGWDSTMLKNKTSMWLAQQIGMPYTPKMLPVDVTLVVIEDGEENSREYVGSYLLSELVEVKKGRVDIDELDENEATNITGGYLLSLYDEEQNKNDSESSVFTVESGVTFMNHTPWFEGEELTEAQKSQRDYIRDYMGQLDKLIMGSETIDEATHEAIAEKMDLKSAANYWWIQELLRNEDAYHTDSTHLYKARDGKLFWGPLWDMDFCAEYSFDKYTLGFCNTSMPWLDALRTKDPKFVELLKERWNDPETGVKVKFDELTRKGGMLDSYKDVIAASWADDRAVQEQNGSANADDPKLDEVAEKLNSWLAKRGTWVNENLDSLDRAGFKVVFVVDGKVVSSMDVIGNEISESMPTAPERAGYRFKEWRREDGETDYDLSRMIVKDTVFEAVYEPEDADGTNEGTNDGANDGTNEGTNDGANEGNNEGANEGTNEGNNEGANEGADAAADKGVSAKDAAADNANVALVNGEYVAMGLEGKTGSVVKAGSELDLNALTAKVEGLFAGTASVSDFVAEQNSAQLGINETVNSADAFTCNANAELNASIKANGDIRFCGSNFNSNSKDNVIYSANGDIYVMSQNANANGFFYAPNGTVYFLGEWANLNETCVIAKDVRFNEKVAHVNPNAKWGNLLEFVVKG